MDDLMFDHLQDESLSDLPESALVGLDPRLSRRRLLGGAAGGFVLAASGLLVPEGVAAERPAERNQNDPNDHHGRRQHHRKDRHDQDRQDKDRQEAKGIRDVEINFYSGSNKTHIIEGWQHDEGGGINKSDRWHLRWHERSVPPVRQLVKFTGQKPLAVLVVKTPGLLTGPIFFKVENFSIGAPRLTVAQGTWGRHGAVNRGHDYVLDKELKENQRIDVEEYWVDRSGDSRDHKIFYVNAKD